MSWPTATLIDGHNAALYVQAAGATATPGTANEVPFATEFTWANEKDIQSRGPHIGSSSIRKTVAGINRSGSLSIDLHAATNTTRALLMTAMNSATTRVKYTLRIGGASGESHVWDQVIVSHEGSVNPAEGVTYSFPWEADSYVYTEGSSYA